MADWKSSQEFLKEFYASPIVNEDTIPAKIKRIFLPKSRKVSALKELAGDLSGEGRAGDVILDVVLVPLHGFGVNGTARKVKAVRKLLVVWHALVVAHIKAAVVTKNAGTNVVLFAVYELCRRWTSSIRTA